MLKVDPKDFPAASRRHFSLKNGQPERVYIYCRVTSNSKGYR